MFTMQKSIAPKLELSNEILCILVDQETAKILEVKVGGKKIACSSLSCLNLLGKKACLGIVQAIYFRPPNLIDHSFEAS